MFHCVCRAIHCLGVTWGYLILVAFSLSGLRSPMKSVSIRGWEGKGCLLKWDTGHNNYSFQYLISVVASWSSIVGRCDSTHYPVATSIIVVSPEPLIS